MKHVNTIKDNVIGSSGGSTPEQRFGTYNKSVAEAIKKNSGDPDALLELAGELSQYSPDLTKSVFSDKSSTR